jgi:hypothetical protein
VRLEGLGKLKKKKKKSKDLTGIRTRDLSVFSIAPQTSALLHTPTRIESLRNIGNTIVMTSQNRRLYSKMLPKLLFFRVYFLAI